MTLAEQIKEAIQSEYGAGMTQEELAKKHHVSQQHIQRLLSGQREYSGLTLATIGKMFPGATLHLHGDPVVANNSGINHGVVGVNNGSLQQSSAEAFRDRAIRAILDLDLSPEISILILKTLKNLK